MVRPLALGLLIVVSAFAQSQLQMNQAAKAAYERADAELNTRYSEIVNRKRSDQAFIAKFRRAQRAWISFRDAHIDSIYPASNARSEYGSVYDLCRYQLLTALTAERVAQLRQWLGGVDETDTCAGSNEV